MTMDKKQRTELIDELLMFMNSEIEQVGCTTKQFYFDFTEAGGEMKKLLTCNANLQESFDATLNVCRSRGYVKGYDNRVLLTEDGQGRAISVDAAKQSPPAQQNHGDIHIGELHAHGATQIGHYNTQQIENVLASIVEKIDQTNAPEAEKQEAKSRLSSFLEHPLTGTAIGLAPVAIKILCGGG